MTVTRLGDDNPATWEAAARLLDEYRQHYGANPAPEAAATWLREQIDAARARVYLALNTGPQPTTPAGATDRAAPDRMPADEISADGICTIAVVPAAVTLRTVWLVRDLYVRPAARRRGVARSLLEAVADEAAASGAHRLSLQTETANTRALELYAASGFAALTELTVMDNVL